MRILKKIGFKEDIYLSVEESAKSHNTDITKEVNRLIKKGLSADDIKVDLFCIKKDIQDIKNISLGTYTLLKQIYANMELNAVDMKTSKCLKDYFKKIKKDNFSD